MEERIEEGKIKNAQPSKLLKETKLNFMNDCICKISSKKIGTGFFCKINYKDSPSPVLITNYHVIDNDYIENENIIKLYINDRCKIININKDRKIYSSENNKYDIMIIELKEEDEIKNFLELDPNIFNNNIENIYKDELIYILHFPYDSNATISYGRGLEKINDYDIKHKCNTENGSSGGPILNFMNNKVIGIHKGCIKKMVKINII